MGLSVAPNNFLFFYSFILRIHFLKSMFVINCIAVSYVYSRKVLVTIYWSVCSFLKPIPHKTRCSLGMKDFSETCLLLFIYCKLYLLPYS